MSRAAQRGRLYQHHNQRPVRLDFVGIDGAPYISIEDLESGPWWSIEPVIRVQTAAQ